MTSIGDEHLQALGRVTVEASRIDSRLRLLAVILLECRDSALGEYIIAKFFDRHGDAMQFISGVLDYKSRDSPSNPMIVEFKQIREKIGKCQEKRNSFIHAEWGVLNINDEMPVYRREVRLMKNQQPHPFKPVDVLELTDLADEMANLSLKLDRLFHWVVVGSPPPDSWSPHR